jgi:uncharacterized protein (TIGR03086 family)
MTSTVGQSIEVLSRALAQTSHVLSDIPDDKLSDATPCRDWDVAQLIAHVVADSHNFVAMATGGQPDWSAAPSLPDDWAGAFGAGAAELIRVWRESGEAASPQAVDMQTAEFAVHAWDLVRATGASMELDPEVAERGLALMSGSLTADNRGQAFAPAVAPPENANVYDRLAAFAGRDPR